MFRKIFPCISIFVLSFSLFSFEVKAEIYGKADCGPTFPCSSYAGLLASDPKIAALIAQANSCVSTYFGLSAAESHFRNELGIGSNQCLTAKPKEKTKYGPPLFPKCCIVPKGGNDMCVLHCDLISG